MTEYRIGSIVCPIWDKERRGKVIGRAGDMCTVKWFAQEFLENWYYANLTFVKPEEKNVNTTTKWRCKPIENMFEVFKGGFTHVVIQDGLIVAAFTSFEDAETYKENLYDDSASIRELES